MLNAYTNYQLISRDIGKAISRVEDQPMVKRESEYYLANIENVKTIDDFLDDSRLFKYAMKAYGLQDMDYAKAFMRKVLEEGVDSDGSFANKLVDKRYAEFATNFDFKVYGDKATSLFRAQQGTVDAYLRQTLEENAGQQNEGVQLALYFERKAPEIDNFYQLLGDPALGKVLRTALGLPESFATAALDRQVAYFESKVDIEDLKDPEGLGKFMKRFTAMWDVSNASSSLPNPATILFGRPAEAGISTNLLLALQQMKR